jgi:hypothetical protein
MSSEQFIYLFMLFERKMKVFFYSFVFFGMPSAGYESFLMDATQYYITKISQFPECQIIGFHIRN